MQRRAISASNRSRDVMPAISDRSRVGVIGLGLLGEALARRLIGAGFPVTGYDLDPAKNASFESLGGCAANSPAAVAASCDCIVLAVFSTDQVETVVERELLPVVGDNSGSLVLCASTCDPDRIAVLGERLVACGMRFLETPGCPFLTHQARISSGYPNPRAVQYRVKTCGSDQGKRPTNDVPALSNRWRRF